MLLNRKEYVKREPDAQEILLRRGKKGTGRKVLPPHAPPISFVAGQVLSFSYLVHRDFKRLNP